MAHTDRHLVMPSEGGLGIPNPSGLLVGQGASKATAFKLNMSATAAPTVNDDSGDGYVVGSRWYDLTNDKVYDCLDATVGAAVWKESTPVAGEANTASNVGSAGVGPFKQKTGVNLEFRNVNAGSSKITVTLDAGNNEIDIDVAEANLTLGNLGGTLGATKGGTSFSTYTLGDTIYSSAANTLSKLSGNVTTTKKFLTQTGDGVNSAAPGWNTIVSGDLPTVPISKGGTNATTGVQALINLQTNIGLIPSSNPLNINVNSSNFQIVNPVTGAFTLNFTGTQSHGQELCLVFVADGGGPYTLTWGTGCKVSASSFSLTASKTHIVNFRSDGTNFIEVSRATMTS